MKKEFFELSMKWGEKAFSGMREAGARVMATDCPLAAMQIEQATGVHPMHPIEVLARAYQRGGFPDAVPPPEPPKENDDEENHARRNPCAGRLRTRARPAAAVVHS